MLSVNSIYLILEKPSIMLKQYSFCILLSISTFPNSDQSTCACTPGFVSYLSVAGTPCFGRTFVTKSLDSAKIEPKFSKEIENRNQRNPITIQNDNDVLRRFARLIAFSQNAPSDRVSDLLDKGIFEEIFHNFKIDEVAKMDPIIVKADHWNKIGVIRFPLKITSIIDCAKSLTSIKSKHGSFMDLLNKCDIPLSLNSEADNERFWQGFDRLRNELYKENMPFFRRSTSLLHFLLHIGYECIKPDLVVMNVANKLGITGSKSEKSKLKVVRIVQLYSVNRKIRPSIVDFYLLIFGGQRWAKTLQLP